MSSIFLSHNHQDKPFVRRLASELRSRGARVWVDEAEIKLGDSLIAKIQAALDEVNYVGVVLSSHSVGSVWVQKEVEIALSRELRGKKIVVLPLLLEDCTLPAFLEGKLYADFRQPEGYADAVELLADRLGLPALQLISLTEATTLLPNSAKIAIFNMDRFSRARNRLLVPTAINLGRLTKWASFTFMRAGLASARCSMCARGLLFFTKAC